MKQSIREKLNKNYQKRKSWYGKNSYLDKAEIFEIESNRAGVKKGDDILEIGFGEGLFLEWASQSGFNINGIEINHDFYTLAQKKGFKVYLGDLKDVINELEKKYNGIFLFDVLEHMTLEEILDLFYLLKRVLKKNGTILTRSPNGASPFGGFLQHGDATHATVLTGSKIQDIAQLSGLVVKGIYNGARTKKKGKHKNWILKSIAYKLRDFIQLVISSLYYGENIPMDPNFTIVMGHTPEE